MQLFTDETVKMGMLKLAMKHSDAMISRICQNQDTLAKSKEIHILYEIILWIVKNKTSALRLLLYISISLSFFLIKTTYLM